MPDQKGVEESAVTVSAIKTILGDKFKYKDHNGNICISFAHLRIMTTIDICQALLHATQQLQTAGYFPDPRLSWQTKDSQWRAWPHIWIICKENIH
tara:strand:+ start:427 stop:714 length:288 start_codon:yes stop_codon:yes gene_type:complete